MSKNKNTKKPKKKKKDNVFDIRTGKPFKELARKGKRVNSLNLFEIEQFRKRNKEGTVKGYVIGYIHEPSDTTELPPDYEPGTGVFTYMVDTVDDEKHVHRLYHWLDYIKARLSEYIR